jgi:hypothetical protein
VENIKMDLGGNGWDGMDWISMAKDRDHWRDYWFSGLCPSSGILNTRKHKVSETGSISVHSFSFQLPKRYVF